jgi:hypothetical protein
MKLSFKLLALTTLIALGTVFFLGSCSRQGTFSAEDASLDGQAFIVTRGAENVRLGQLDVHLVERRSFDDLHLLESALKEQEQIRREFETAKKAGDKREQLVENIKTEYANLVSERDRLVQALPGSVRLHEVSRKDGKGIGEIAG